MRTEVNIPVQSLGAKLMSNSNIRLIDFSKRSLCSIRMGEIGILIYIGNPDQALRSMNTIALQSYIDLKRIAIYVLPKGTVVDRNTIFESIKNQITSSVPTLLNTAHLAKAAKHAQAMNPKDRRESQDLFKLEERMAGSFSGNRAERTQEMQTLINRRGAEATPREDLFSSIRGHQEAEMQKLEREFREEFRKEMTHANALTMRSHNSKARDFAFNYASFPSISNQKIIENNVVIDLVTVMFEQDKLLSMISIDEVLSINKDIYVGLIYTSDYEETKKALRILYAQGTCLKNIFVLEDDGTPSKEIERTINLLVSQRKINKVGL